MRVGGAHCRPIDLGDFMKAILTPLLVAVLGGCAGQSYILDNYSATAMPDTVSTPADNWWIFDKPTEGKMLVQRNPGSAAAQGFFGGLMLNPTVTAAPKPLYEQAAQAFLAKTGRSCTIKDGYLIIEPSWEFKYECTGAAIATSSLPPAR